MAARVTSNYSGDNRQWVYELPGVSAKMAPPHIPRNGGAAACAAGIATQKIYESEGVFERSAALEDYFLDAVWTLQDHPLVADIRGIGLMAGVEVHSDGVPGRRGGQMQKDMFWNGLHVKWTGDNAIVAPAFVAERKHIDEIVDKFRKTLDEALEASV